MVLLSGLHQTIESVLLGVSDFKPSIKIGSMEEFLCFSGNMVARVNYKCREHWKGVTFCNTFATCLTNTVMRDYQMLELIQNLGN